MAVLEHVNTGERVVLPQRALAGRAFLCAVRLTSAGASSEHASLSHKAGRWRVRDLGSRNGTWVDGRRLSEGERADLEVGATLQFGTQEETWRLVDDGPAGAVATRVRDGHRVGATDGVLALPSHEAAAWYAIEGRGGSWVDPEAADGPATLRDQTVVEVEGEHWLITLPVAAAMPTTIDRQGEWTLARTGLSFAVSLDEEHVELTVSGPDGATTLAPRAYHYTLLLLARIRRDDHEAAEAERGWVYTPELTRMLGFADKTVNIHVYRLRRELAGLGIVDADDLIERRPATQQLRISAIAWAERRL